jgi:TolB-like protein
MRSSITQLRGAGVDPEKWLQLKCIVTEALERAPGGDRSAFLRQRCGDDTELLRETESLLAEADALQSADAFEECAQNASRTLRTEDASAVGRRLGAYTLVREIGRGGMGSVYLAARADGVFEKQVAIKLLKRGTDTDEVLARFNSERRILARLDHAHIARLLDAGATEDGLPYFVMEYVQGRAVTRFVRERHLSLHERLALFLKICSAVEKAHRSGIVHRDLKPGNIVVDEDGEPKLLDFGIAKLLSEQGPTIDITAKGAQLLSPVCASPEQARGEPVTAASDTYALGALLFELLAGRPAHRFSSKSPSSQEVARVICEDSIAPPSVAALDSQTASEIAGPLDAIVLRAMQKAPENRYTSVAAFADDVQKYLRESEPAAVGDLAAITRRTPPALASRRRTVFAAAAAALLIGLAVAGWLSLRQVDAPAGASQFEFPLDDKGIAVLPFENLSSAPENAFFAVGVQEAILTDLAKIAELKVINPNTVRYYSTAAPRDLRDISRQLQVAYVLQGSVQREGNDVRITAKLSDARSNAQVWAERYDRQLADVFALQEEIADKIASQLRVKFSPSARAPAHLQPTRDLVAYDLYLRAQQRDRGMKRDIGSEQVTLLNEAVVRDPRFVAAWCLLSRVHLRMHVLNLDNSPERLELGRRALSAAQELAPDSGEVQLAQAIYLYWGLRDYNSALDRLAIARRSLPNDASIPYFTALIKRRQGEWEQSVKYFQQTAALDPLDSFMLLELVHNYRVMRQYSDAAQLVDSLIASNRDEFLFHQARAEIEVSSRAATRVLRDLLKSDRASSAAAELLQLPQVELALADRDYLAARQALGTSSQRYLRTVFMAMPREYYEGLVARGLGDDQQAQRFLEKARAAAAELADAQPRNGFPLMALSYIEARLGEAEPAQRHAEQAAKMVTVKDDAPGGARMLTDRAAIYALTGDTERALDLLEESARLAGGVDYGSLRLHDAWDSLRDEPRFTRLVASLAP